MLSRGTLAFVLATVTSSLAWSAPPTHVPFVPSTVQRPDSHAGRFGLITIVTYGAFGQKTTSTQVIDLDTYIRSGAKTMVTGQAAAKQAEADGICLVPDPIDGGCETDTGSVGGDAGSGSGTGNGGSGSGPNINPNGSGPGSGAPTPPDPPNPATVSWNVGVVTYTQYYDNGQWEQTTTYSRNVYPDTQSDGQWGNPVTSQSKVKH